MKKLIVVLAAASAVWAAGPPVIQDVVNGANFQPGISAASWVTIRGVNLAGTTREWQNSDFQGGALPTSLDGVQVRINRQSAYIAYVSAAQLNVLAPDDPATGAVSVQVITAAGTSATVTATKTAVAPALFTYSPQNGRYVLAQNGSTFELLAPAVLLGRQVTTRPAKPGETIALYATGLGTASPALPAGRILSSPAQTANPVQVSIGGQPAVVTYSGLIGSGLYQINAVVPNLPADDYLVSLQVSGVSSESLVYLKVQDTLPGTYCYEIQGLSAFGDPGIVIFQMNGVPEPVVRESGGITTATYTLTGFPGHKASFAFRYNSYTDWNLSRIILTRGPSSSGMTLHLGVTAATPDVTVTLVGPPGLFASNALPATLPPLSDYSTATLVTVMLDFRLSPPATPLYLMRNCVIN